MSSFLKFTVNEDSQMFPISIMTEPETAAIAECINELLPSPTQANYWFEPDLCILDEEFYEDGEEPVFGLLRCYTYNLTPKNGSVDENRIPHPFPSELLTKFSGKTFLVEPRQLGLSPWGKKVEIVFESVDLPLVEKPVNGIRASDLIAAALKQ
jgi:hypothetical protein